MVQAGEVEMLRDVRLPDREVGENCALLGCYSASGGDLLPTFRDNLSVPSLGVENLKESPLSQPNCPDTSVTNYQYPLRNSSEERSSLGGILFSPVVFVLVARQAVYRRHLLHARIVFNVVLADKHKVT
jgi:hypothetical protein